MGMREETTTYFYLFRFHHEHCVDFPKEGNNANDSINTIVMEAHKCVLTDVCKVQIINGAQNITL
jgi:hypothetical protein